MFVMVGKEELASVLLRASRCKRPKATVQVLAELIRRLEWDGTATFARAELAAEVDINITTVSLILNDLETFGVIVTRKSDGRRLKVGVNANLATMLRGDKRRAAQARAPAIQPAA